MLISLLLKTHSEINNNNKNKNNLLRAPLLAFRTGPKFDVLKSCIQTLPDSAPAHEASMWGTAKREYRLHGAKFFFRGLGATLVGWDENAYFNRSPIRSRSHLPHTHAHMSRTCTQVRAAPVNAVTFLVYEHSLHGLNWAQNRLAEALSSA